MIDPFQTEETEKINKGLARVYGLLFVITLATIFMSIISSESRPQFEMRLRQQEGLVICTNNMAAAGLECRTQSSGDAQQREIKDATIVKEYSLKVSHKTDVEGLEFTGEDSKKLIMSTGSFGGHLSVLSLNK